MKLKLALAQIATKLGDVESNLEKHLEYIKKAKSQKADLLVFPEAETLEGLKEADGKQIVPGIFAAVPYCVDLIGGPYLETRDEVCKAFRPKSAVRATRPA